MAEREFFSHMPVRTSPDMPLMVDEPFTPSLSGVFGLNPGPTRLRRGQAGDIDRHLDFALQ